MRRSTKNKVLGAFIGKFVLFSQKSLCNLNSHKNFFQQSLITN